MVKLPLIFISFGLDKFALRVLIGNNVGSTNFRANRHVLRGCWERVGLFSTVSAMRRFSARGSIRRIQR